MHFLFTNTKSADVYLIGFLCFNFWRGVGGIVGNMD